MTDEAMETNPLLTPTSLAALVDYQSGSVVSRTIMKEATGTVTLFAFAEGEGLSEHTVPFDALVTILDGAAHITVGSEEHEVAAGEGLLLPAAVPHALHASTRFKMMLVMIRRPQ
jgi:quercetin dioxygenase-like cupin family protein